VKAHRKRAVTARVSFFVTVFGNAKSITIPVRSTPQNVNDAIQCFGFTPRTPERPLSTDLICRSAFRWPNLYLQASTANSPVAVPLAQTISYSPFPAEASINPVESKWAAISPADEVTIRMSEPVAHFRRDVEIKSATLDELAGFDGTYFWR
jgi:hypothetical protein